MQFALPFMAAASAVSAGGQLLAGQGQQSAYNQQAALEAQQGRVAIEQSNYRAGQIQDETSQVEGRQKAAYGSSGVDASGGTPLQVMADTARKGAMARLTAQYQGRVNATSSLEQADAEIAAGHAARVAGYIGAGTSLLGGVARGVSMAAPSAGNIPMGP